MPQTVCVVVVVRVCVCVCVCMYVCMYAVVWGGGTCVLFAKGVRAGLRVCAREAR